MAPVEHESYVNIVENGANCSNIEVFIAQYGSKQTAKENECLPIVLLVCKIFFRQREYLILLKTN